jgi:hypothetical protein
MLARVSQAVMAPARARAHAADDVHRVFVASFARSRARMMPSSA